MRSDQIKFTCNKASISESNTTKGNYKLETIVSITSTKKLLVKKVI